jgi:hypothetical protein
LLVADQRTRDGRESGVLSMQAALQNTSIPRMFVSDRRVKHAYERTASQRRVEPQRALTGLDEDDSEHVFFHGAPTA